MQRLNAGLNRPTPAAANSAFRTVLILTTLVAAAISAVQGATQRQLIVMSDSEAEIAFMAIPPDVETVFMTGTATASMPAPIATI